MKTEDHEIGENSRGGVAGGSQFIATDNSLCDYEEHGTFGEDIGYEYSAPAMPLSATYDDVRVYREIYRDSKVSVGQLAQMLSLTENDVCKSIRFFEKYVGLKRIKVNGVWHWQYGKIAGGAQVIAADKRDAVNCVPPVRSHPSRNSVMTYHDNRSIILYVTVVTEKRKPILVDTDAVNCVPPAKGSIVNCILEAWKAATEWLVGWYVIMPDHIHFFCAPATYPPPDFHRWMKRWKSLATIEYRKLREREGRSLLRPENTDATSCVPLVGTAGRSQFIATDKAIRNPPLFQRDCWDRQLRTGESYAQKWEYMRNNPVRKGLVANANDWPYQGRMNILEWHERI